MADPNEDVDLNESVLNLSPPGLPSRAEIDLAKKVMSVLRLGSSSSFGSIPKGREKLRTNVRI